MSLVFQYLLKLSISLAVVYLFYYFVSAEAHLL